MSQNPGVNPIDPSQKMLEMFFQGDQASKTRAHEQSMLRTRVNTQAAIAKDQSKMQLLAQQQRLEAAKDQQTRELAAQKDNYQQYQQFQLQRDKQAHDLKKEENEEIMKKASEKEMARLKYVEGMNYSDRISNMQKLKAMNQYREDQASFVARSEELMAHLAKDKVAVDSARLELLKSLEQRIVEAGALEELFGTGLAGPSFERVMGDSVKELWPLFTTKSQFGENVEKLLYLATPRAHEEHMQAKARDVLVALAKEGIAPSEALSQMTEQRKPVGGLFGTLQAVHDFFVNDYVDFPARALNLDLREAYDDEEDIADNALGLSYLMIGQMERWSKMQFDDETYIDPQDTATAAQTMNLLLRWGAADQQQRSEIKQQVGQLMQQGNPKVVAKMIDTLGLYGQAYAAAAEFARDNPNIEDVPFPTGDVNEQGEPETVPLEQLLPGARSGRELQELAEGMADVFGRIGQTRLALDETGYGPPDQKGLLLEAERIAEALEMSTTPEAAAEIKDRVYELAQQLVMKEEQQLELPFARFVDSLDGWERRRKLQQQMKLEGRGLEHAQMIREEEAEGGALGREGMLLQEYMGDLSEMLE